MLRLRTLAVLFALALPLFADPISDALLKAIEQTKVPPDSSRGDALYSEKLYDEAAIAYLEHVTKRPDDGSAWYNLACCLALLDRKNDAIVALEQAVKGGFTDVSHMKADTDLESIRKKKAYKAIVKGLDTASGSKPKTEWISGEALLPCYVRKPKDFDSKKSYGLVLLLHGRGDTAEHFLESVEEWRGDDFILAAIETPYVLALPGGRNGRCWAPWESGKDNTKEAYQLSAETVGRTLKSLKEKYSVDPKKVYLLGFSEGAFMAAHCGIKFGDQISGMIVISGGLDPSLIAKEDYAKAKFLRILVAHGTSDAVVPYDQGRKLFADLENNWAKPDFFPFEGGHSIPQIVREGVNGWLRGKEIPEESKDKSAK